MSTPESPQDAAVSADAIPARTTPTWEMEMLLSGATVFGMLQLPDALNAAVEPVLARLGGDVAMFGDTLAAYAGAAVYLLLATFVGHLVIRGFWIALLGLRSVYPQGPDFERLRGGPIARDVARHHTARIEIEVERLDNLATIVFVFGAIAVLGVLMPALLVAPMFGIAYFFPQVPVTWLLLGVLALLVGPLALAALLDQWFGYRLRREGRIARMLASVLGAYQHALQPRFMNVMTTTLVTRLGFGRFMFSYLLALCFALLVHSAHLTMRREGRVLGDFDWMPIPAGTAHVVLPEHYRETRLGADALRRVPFIDAPVVEGDWLRVVVPFHPTRHEAAIKAQCPEVWDTLPLSDALDAAAAETAHRDLLACYRDIAAIHVDGRPMDVLPDIVVLPDTRLRGLQFMIDARELAPGRHVLQTARPPRSETDDAGKKPAPYRIPFWR